MFHNLFVPGLAPLSNTDEIRNWDNQPFRTAWPEPGTSDQKCNDNKTLKRTIRKKRKRMRTIFTTQQLIALEELYGRTKYINPEKRRQISDTLKLNDKQVKVWFQNRRMKDKRESSESSWDSSSDHELKDSPPPLLESPGPQYEDISSDSTPRQPTPVYQEVTPQYDYVLPEFLNLAPGSNTVAEAFLNDTTEYPTEYYPYYYNSWYPYPCQEGYQYGNYDQYGQNNWDVNNFDVNYF